jgi:hypothetical protein
MGVVVQPIEAAELILSAALGDSREEAILKFPVESFLTGRGSERIDDVVQFDLTSDIRGYVGSGFYVIGAKVRGAIGTIGSVRISNANSLTVENDTEQAEVLILFEDGSGTVLPVFPGYVGIVRFKDDLLFSVHYERLNSEEVEHGRFELDNLRFAMREALAVGSLALDFDSASRLASRLHGAPFVDPALAVYASYAFQSAGRLQQIVDLRAELSEKQRMRLFDVDLLARKGKVADIPSTALTTPLLSQGWAFVDALLPGYPDHLKQLRGHVGQSLWSHYDSIGVKILASWIEQRVAIGNDLFTA